MLTILMRPILWLFPILLWGCTPPIVKITDPIIREPIPGSYVTAGYFDITNVSPSVLVLNGGIMKSAKVEMHRTTSSGTRMSMSPVKSLPIKPGETIKLTPGGLHFMIFLYQQTLDSPNITLLFKSADSSELLEIPIKFDVVPIEEITTS